MTTDSLLSAENLCLVVIPCLNEEDTQDMLVKLKPSEDENFQLEVIVADNCEQVNQFTLGSTRGWFKFRKGYGAALMGGIKRPLPFV